MVKRTACEEYAVRKQKYAAISLRAGDALLAVLADTGAATRGETAQGAPPERAMLLLSRGGMSILFDPASIPATGRVTGGVKGIQLDLGDALLWADLVGQEGELLVISDRGFGKRILMVDFDLQNRNGKGLKAFTFNKNGSNGTCVAAACAVCAPYAVRVCQSGGLRTPMSTDDVMIEQRASKGKMLVMALMDDVVTELMTPCVEDAPQGGAS